MAEISRNDVRLEHLPAGTLSDEDRLPGEPLLPELPETSAASPRERSSNGQLNRSAQAVGHRVGCAVAGVRSLPQQFGRLRSRIHLVGSPSPDRDFDELAGDWRDAVEGSVSEMSDAARRYQAEFMERANLRFAALKRRGERQYYTLRRNVWYRLDKVRRVSSEQPLEFIAFSAGTAFVLGAVLRIWRSNHE